MRLRIDMSGVTFTVTREAEEKKDQTTGRQKVDRNTKELLWTVQVMALDGSGGEMLNVTVAGAVPRVTVGAQVRPVDLEAIPWATKDRHGVAFRASQISPVAAAPAKVA